MYNIFQSFTSHWLVVRLAAQCPDYKRIVSIEPKNTCFTAKCIASYHRLYKRMHVEGLIKATGAKAVVVLSTICSPAHQASRPWSCAPHFSGHFTILILVKSTTDKFLDLTLKSVNCNEATEHIYLIYLFRSVKVATIKSVSKINIFFRNFAKIYFHFLAVFT